MTAFRPFFNPATGEWIEYTVIGEDNGGELVCFNWRSVPGGAITEHIHPHQEERFAILAGEAHFTIAGQEATAKAGETIVVPPGVRHSEGNLGSAEIAGVVELRPALRTKEFHEAVAGLVADGRTTTRGAPKNPLRLGAIFWHSATKASDPRRLYGFRTSCCRPWRCWRRCSACALRTKIGTACVVQ